MTLNCARPDCDDIIFWNESGEITESTIANVVVQIDGELCTPPVESGLLAGTFRNQLLAEGKIKERVITIDELKNAGEFFLINSVRKWMKASFRRSECTVIKKAQERHDMAQIRALIL